jgi:transposase
MRGEDIQQGSMFSYTPLEQRIAPDHPLRPVREMVDEALRSMSQQIGRLYPKGGRPSIPPERLFRALVLQSLYSIRSERMLMEQLEYNFLYRWFVGLGVDDPVWDPTVFTKNRDRVLSESFARSFFDSILAQARDRELLSSEHFTVDGTLIGANASQKSFVRKGKKPPKPNQRKRRRNRGHDDDPGNPTVNFRGENRSNRTHESTTDPEARLSRKKGQTSQLAYMGHLLTENRNGLIVNARLTEANGYAERDAAIEMLGDLPAGGRVTLGADRGYDTGDFVERCRALGVTPHVAQNTTNRRSRIDDRTVRHPGYAVSQKKRKRVEECFGWMKTIGGLRQTRHRGRSRVSWAFLWSSAAYNLVRMRNLAVPA